MRVDNTWIDNVPPEDSTYWDRVRHIGELLQSDKCTLSLDVFTDACIEHDIHWRTGTTIYGIPITAQQANRRLRKVIQARSRAGVLSPMSWCRWGVTSLSKYAIRPVAALH